MILLPTNIKLQETSFDLLTDRLTPSATDRLLIMYGILLQHLFLRQLCTVDNGIFYGRCKQLFVSELNNP